MENTALKKTTYRPSVETTVNKSPRPRSMTTLKMEWLAERVRKCRRIKQAIEEGTYNVDSRDVAKALLNLRDFTERE